MRAHQASLSDVDRAASPIEVDGHRVVFGGRWIRIAQVEDEEWLAGHAVREPELFVRRIREAGSGADLFTFCQKPPDTRPRFGYPLEWDNLAVVRTVSFADWWKTLPQVTRKNVRRAERRGVVIRSVPCDDSLIRGIVDIYNEVPVRDGKPFRHFGKDFETIKQEASTMADRSEFLGAYHEEELIGFIKLIHMGSVSSILHIASKRRHYDKRPSNALIAHAISACQRHGTEHLIYGSYDYGVRSDSPLAEFKRRNGFEQMLVPRYYIPLSAWGAVCVRLKLHHGMTEMFPRWCVDQAVRLRTKYYNRQLNRFLLESGAVTETDES
jgi:hypothetical protein